MKSRRSLSALIVAAGVGIVLAGVVAASRPAMAIPARQVSSSSTSLPGIARVSALDALPETRSDSTLRTAVERQIAATTERGIGVSGAMDPGAFVPTSFRILQTGLGSANRQLYGFRTAKRLVCIGITQGPSGCISGFPDSLPITYTFGDPDGISGAEPPIVFGLAEDNVAEVVVTAGRRTASSAVVNNSYFIQFDHNASLPPGTTITAVTVDGRRSTVTIRG